MSGFPLPEPPHRFRPGDRAKWVLEQRVGTVAAVSNDIGALGLPYCEMEWDDGTQASWVLMQHLWPYPAPDSVSSSGASPASVAAGTEGES